MRFRNPIFGIISFIAFGLLLQIFKETSWAIFVERLLEEAAHSLHIERAAMVATLSQVLLGGGLLWAALYFAFRVGKAERPIQPDPTIEIARAHTEAIRAQTEVLRVGPGKKQPDSNAFSLSPTVHCECYELLSSGAANTPGRKPTGLYRNFYYLAIGNALPDGRTIRRLRVTVSMVGEPVVTRLKSFHDGIGEIRHGEMVLAQLGSIVSDEMIGPYKGQIIAQDSDLSGYRHNVPLGYVSFEIESHSGKREFGLAGWPGEGLWPMSVIASADDILSMQLRAFVDLTDGKKPKVSVSQLR